MNSKRETISRIGIASKGIVYILIGLLTAFASFGIGNSKSSSYEALKFLSKQSYGKILVIMIGIGLLGYLFFKFYQAFSNLKNHDENAKGYLLRASYVMNGLAYGLLGYTAIKMIFDNDHSGARHVANLLNSYYGNVIAIIIGIVLLGKSIFEFNMGFSEKFKDDIEHASLDDKAKNILLKAGKIGFTSRGIVASLLAFLFFKAGITSTTEDINRTDAFILLQDEFGSLVVIIVAMGLVGYGIFILIKSKYPDVNL